MPNQHHYNIAKVIGKTGRSDFSLAQSRKNPDESSDDRAKRIAGETAARNALIKRQNEERQARIDAKQAEREARRRASEKVEPSEKPVAAQPPKAELPERWEDYLPSSADAGFFAKKGKRGSQPQQSVNTTPDSTLIRR